MKSVIALLTVACLAACVYGQMPGGAAGSRGISPAMISALARGGGGSGMNLLTLGLINGGMGEYIFSIILCVILLIYATRK